jgi:hypothetical protein
MRQDNFIGMISFMHFAEIPLATIAVIIFISRIADVAGVALSGPLADLASARSLPIWLSG